MQCAQGHDTTEMVKTGSNDWLCPTCGHEIMISSSSGRPIEHRKGRFLREKEHAERIRNMREYPELAHLYLREQLEETQEHFGSSSSSSVDTRGSDTGSPSRSIFAKIVGFIILIVAAMWVLKHPGLAFSLVASIVGFVFYAVVWVVPKLLQVIGTILGAIWDIL